MLRVVFWMEDGSEEVRRGVVDVLSADLGVQSIRFEEVEVEPVAWWRAWGGFALTGVLIVCLWWTLFSVFRWLIGVLM